MMPLDDMSSAIRLRIENDAGEIDPESLLRALAALRRGDFSVRLEGRADAISGRIAEEWNGLLAHFSASRDCMLALTRAVSQEDRSRACADAAKLPGAWAETLLAVNAMLGQMPESSDQLTAQLKAMSDVVSAVSRGELSRTIAIETHGELALLKDHLNGMIGALREARRDREEQSWLNAQLARFTRLLQEERDMNRLSSRILSELAPLVSAHLGAFYISDASPREPRLVMVAGYGCQPDLVAPASYAMNEGLIGQCAADMRRMLLKDVPAAYFTVASGLGSAPPASIVVLPIVTEHGVKAIVELASFREFTEIELCLLDHLMELIAVVFTTLEANSRTESLLAQSQSLAQELGRTNSDLAEKARLLAAQNSEVEHKNDEVEQAKRALEEKAAQLALASRYKSEFLANMSHELRTPLNSLLILAEQLADNPTGNLDARQLEYARTIHAAGSDLLSLINDILDLSKIESGTVTLEFSEYRFEHLRSYVERTFRHMAEARGLRFELDLAADLPQAIVTDVTRLQQILRNLLANAFKFTSRGSVSLRVRPVQTGWSAGHPSLSQADTVLAFTVADTGIGIPAEKLRLIFEAFQQADGSTARKYGGTGLGLSISRELASLLGGEIQVESELHAGSAFTFYLPQRRLVGAGEGMCTVFAASGTALSLLSGVGHLLLVEDDLVQRGAITAAFEEAGWRVSVAENGGQGLQLLKSDSKVDCMVFDLHLPDIDGIDLLDMIANDAALQSVPVVVHTAAQPVGAELARLGRLVRGVLVKDPDSPRRLVQEVQRLFVPGAAHAVTPAAFARSALSAPLPESHAPDIQSFSRLAGRQVLIVDDDLRNIFALSSLVERHGMTALFAENGREGIEMLARHPTVDIVLMDVMMPEMDGYDTMRAIRRIPECADLPIIALTAKAMKEDREKCIAAGASDYIAKPVESAFLLQMMLDLLTQQSEN
jgi:signal transduction histidine kinase/DNA-binding response OmpR family regulator/HAMP domain-containing protein